MKQFKFIILFCFTGMTIFAQSVSYYIEEYNNPALTHMQRLEMLEIVQGYGETGLGEFYHNALKILNPKLPDLGNREDREAAEVSARIICQGLAAEKYTAAANDVWYLVQFFDVVKGINDGFVMQEALITMGQIGANNYLVNIVRWLDDMNTRETSDSESRRRIQRAVVGAISALEALHHPDGFRPVFFAHIGWYDPSIKAMASSAMINILEDPGEVISKMIQDPSNSPSIKLIALESMLRTNAPNESKAKVAAVALATGWNYSTSSLPGRRDLAEMRKSAIMTIGKLGAADNSVYTNLDKSYNNNFISTVTDYDEIRVTLETLSLIKTDEAVNLLLKYLRDLNHRRRTGSWGVLKERQSFNWVIAGLGASGTQSMDVRMLLSSIQRSQDYTGAEQNWARDALKQLGY